MAKESKLKPSFKTDYMFNLLINIPFLLFVGLIVFNDVLEGTRVEKGSAFDIHLSDLEKTD